MNAKKRMDSEVSDTSSGPHPFGNAVTNGHASGHANAQANGHTNGHANGTVSSFAKPAVMSFKDKRPRYNESTFLQLFFSLQAVGTLLIALVLIWTLNYYGAYGWTDLGERFNWHPTLMVLGMIYLAGNSLLIFRFMREQPKQLVKIVHASIHISAFFFSLIGSLAVFTGRFQSGRNNLYTLHSWIGFGTMLLFFAQYGIAFFTYLYPMASGQQRSALLPYHVFAGFAIFGCAVVSVLTGFAEKNAFDIGNYNKYQGRMWYLNMIGVFTVIFALLVFFLGTEKSYKRTAVNSEQIPLTSDHHGEDSGGRLNSPN